MPVMQGTYYRVKQTVTLSGLSGEDANDLYFFIRKESEKMKTQTKDEIKSMELFDGFCIDYRYITECHMQQSAPSFNFNTGQSYFGPSTIELQITFEV